MSENGFAPGLTLGIAIIMIAIAWGLSGCGATVPKPTVVIKVIERKIDIPPQLRKCDGVTPVRMESQASAAKNLNRYVGGLTACSGRHDRTIDLIDKFNAAVDQANAD
jgi:hypothetical protein